MEELKSWLNQILGDQNTSVEEKYNLVIGRIPNYLSNIDEKKAVYEKIEGIFHDGLGTYFELIIYDSVNFHYHLNQQEAEKSEAKRKMKLGIDLYNRFFQSNEYNINLENDIINIESASRLALEKIVGIVGNANVIGVTSSAQDFHEGNARDVYIELGNGETLNFSIKTDKSGKVAVFEGQTPRIQEKVYSRYFNLSDVDFNQLLTNTFPGQTLDMVKSDYQNIALLTQKVIIKQLGLENAEINNLENARITNIENLRNLITKLRYYKRSDDDSIMIAADRQTGNLIEDAVIDKIDIDNLNLSNFCLSKTSSRRGGYGTEPTFYYIVNGKKEAFVSFQTKHKRGQRSSTGFQDITIRLRTA